MFLHDLSDACFPNVLRIQYRTILIRSLSPSLAHSVTSSTSQSCGTQWDAYTLGISGSSDCGSCGTPITDYDECLAASNTAASILNIGELIAEGYWDGPYGCHIEDGGSFLFNGNNNGGGADGYTPVCSTNNCFKVASRMCA